MVYTLPVLWIEDFSLPALLISATLTDKNIFPPVIELSKGYLY